ncbi:MAG: site-2 protease family protein [Proteobacteria bacterium]|nr:site-2 protease family protein [Pseudomonadota bacterium]
MLIVRVPAILIALTVHELAHGMVAKMMGDRTAELQGRLTLNPLAHLDILGTMMLFFGPFGWAKPVPVNPMNFQNPRKGMALVAAAGPLSNITLAALTGLFFRLGLVTPGTIFYLFISLFFMINIGLAVFNLLPVYPLDGSRILMAFLPRYQLEKYMRAMAFVPQLFLMMIVVEWLFKTPVLSLLLMPIFNPIFKAATFLFIGS